MVWYKNLYTSESISDADARRIRHRMKLRGFVPGIYLVTLPSNAQNLLDIIPSWNLRQKGYPKRELRIIGLAWGYDEAIELVQRMVQEVYDATGGVDIASYLKEVGGRAG